MAGLILLVPVMFAFTAAAVLLSREEVSYNAYARMQKKISKLENKIDKFGKRM